MKKLIASILTVLTVGASAQITYKGVGSSANAQRTPWGTNLLFSLWPF